MGRGQQTKIRGVEQSIICGDCLHELTRIKRDSIDLILTSPPYAGKRSGIPFNYQYVSWFLQRSAQFKRVLKPSGSFVLNIKEGVTNGQREIYVMELILELIRKQDWIWTEEYIWHKPNAFPGKWSNRFRDAWERCLHFTKEKRFNMYQDAVRRPVKDWAISRLKNLSDEDMKRHESATKSGFGRNVSHWKGRKLVYPDNVIELAGETGNKQHDAVFPIGLPSWFIKLFTKEGDLVLDPFAGSGTTCVAAKKLGRSCLGIDIDPKSCEIARQRVATTAEASSSSLGGIRQSPRSTR
jgi:DNA modification methylase